MRKKLSLRFTTLLAISAATLFTTATSATAQETILYSFGTTSTDGRNPYGNLIFDDAGNLYGTTANNGAFGGGTVFELSPVAGGGWTETSLHSFNPNTKDGYSPFASLIFGATGNLYGTAAKGGAHGGGTVFELSPNASGSWTEKTLHNFTQSSTTDGYDPQGNLVLDAAGNIYGTTDQGGPHSSGIAFELSPNGTGGYAEKLLHAFGASADDGNYPNSALIFDAAGNLYGTTEFGGLHTYGTAFELIPEAGGKWTEKILHNFNNNGTDGYQPEAGLIFDAAGNLYGTTEYGGVNFAGAVIELKPATGGHWTESVLHSFTDQNPDGGYPVALLVFDPAGNLYSTTAGGGVYGDGMVFELSPATGGTWTETQIYSFNESAGDGFIPLGALVLDSAGNLYGTTAGGGVYGGGTVFEITH
jgi:uncharacterized repeat protein (TIGR03803 family)